MEYEKLLDSVIHDLADEKARHDEGKHTFNRGCSMYNESCRQALINYAENGTPCPNECEFCQHFKWAIDRAKLYADKLQIPWKEIIQSWEEDRHYWYMNYYQECNQPKIESDNVFVFESAEEMRKQVGNKFMCPCCHGISTNPYECNSGKKLARNKTCNWTSYGLLQFDLAFIYCKAERKSTKCFMPVALMKNKDTE